MKKLNFEELEKNILTSFKKQMGDEVKDLKLIVCISPDCWPDDLDEIYTAEVMEEHDNGRVWTCQCTRNGIVKETYEL